MHAAPCSAGRLYGGGAPWRSAPGGAAVQAGRADVSGWEAVRFVAVHKTQGRQRELSALWISDLCLTELPLTGHWIIRP